MSAANLVPVETMGFKFTEKNYAAWEFQFRMFLKGNELWNHIDGTSLRPTETSELRQWEIKDARIISWILASFEHHMVVNSLRSFGTAKEMWDHLKRVTIKKMLPGGFNLNLTSTIFVKTIFPLISIILVLLTSGVNTLIFSILQYPVRLWQVFDRSMK